MVHSNPNFQSFTIQDYLNEDNMHQDSVYGEDVEIAAFCYIFKTKRLYSLNLQLPQLFSLPHIEPLSTHSAD